MCGDPSVMQQRQPPMPRPQPTGPSIGGALKDSQFWRDIGGNTSRVAQGMTAGALGGSVDLMSAAVRPFAEMMGKPMPPKSVVGSSDWIGQKLGHDTQSIPWLAGSIGPIPDAMDAGRLAGLMDPNALMAMGGAVAKYPGKFLNEIAESGRYNIRSAGKKAGRDEYEYDILGTDDWPLAPGSFLRDPDTGATFPRRSQPYNPEIATPRAVEDKFGVTVQFDLKPGWSRDISPPEGDFIYRGMSWEEWENIQKTGRIRSMGDYNMSGEQQGLTYFSTEPGVASHYGTGFAPAKYSPAPGRPAVVVAIPRREGVRVPGTGRDEVGVPGHIDASEIRHVWEGHPYAVTRSGNADVIEEFGQIRDGSRFDPSTPVAWKKAR